MSEPHRVPGKLSAAGPGPAIRIRSYRVTVQSPVVLVTLTPDADVAFRVETTRTDPTLPTTVWKLVYVVNEPTALASIPLPNDPATPEPMRAVTVEDRHASAVMGILDMQAPVCMTEAPLPME